VTFIACVGEGADQVEDEIDEMIQFDTRHITTTAHAEENLDEVMNLVSAMAPLGEIEEVRF
jgi:hypothetical protein